VDKMATSKKQTAGSFKAIFILILLIIGIFFYWNKTKSSLNSTYTIKTAGDQGGYRASFINRTGKDVEEKKIKLSDDYWTSGKFIF
jgi:hypothetical protein